MAFLASSLVSAAAMGSVMTAGNPYINALNQGANGGFPVTKPDPNTLVKLLRRKIISNNIYYELMSSWGYNEHVSNQIYVGETQILGIQETLTLYRRGELKSAGFTNEAAYYEHLSHLGIGRKVAEQLLKSTEIIASPEQLITFMVREVFNDEISAKFGQYKEFPDDLPTSKTKILPEFAKLGISETLARRIWAAHWTLPDFNSAAQSYYRFGEQNKQFWQDEVKEMGISPEEAQMDLGTLDELLKTKDVMPYWRPKLLAASFQDLGQLQIRWAIRFRFVKYDEAVYLHERQGLPKKWAALVTKIVFVVQSITDWKDGIAQGSMTFADVQTELKEWNITEESIIKVVRQKLNADELSSVTKYRELSLAKVIKAFKQKQIDRPKTLELIQKLKYEENTAKFILEVETFDDTLSKPQKEKDLTKADIIAAFKVDRLTKAESKERLLELKYSVQEAEILLDIAERVKLGKSDKEKLKERDLTKADIIRSLKLGIRDAQSAFDALVMLNYDQDEAIELIEQTLTALANSEAKK